MYGKKDRELMQGIYAKLCAVEKQLLEWRNEVTPEVKLAELPEEPKSPYLNEEGLYSRNHYRKVKEAKANGELKGVI